MIEQSQHDYIKMAII